MVFIYALYLLDPEANSYELFSIKENQNLADKAIKIIKL